MKHLTRGSVRRPPVRLAASVAMVALIPALAGSAAYAQTAPAADAAAASQQPLETIEVTGSRISNTDAASANPISVVGSAEIANEQSATVEDVLRKIPAVDFTGGITQQANNGGLGASEIGLRNLTPQRTLVLVNGQRFPYTDTQGSADAVDFNNIPVEMIDRIEILRDGASSVYGADAIAGVINVITKQHFNGVEVGGGYGESSYGDATRYNVYSTVGSDFDRGNILINVEYSKEDPVLSGARAWSSNQHPEADYNYFDGVSSRVTGAIGQFAQVGGGARKSIFFYGSGINQSTPEGSAYLLGTTVVDPVRGFTTGGKLPFNDIAIPGGPVLFNILPEQGLLSGLERKQVNLTANYDIFDNVTASVEAFYTNRSSSEQLNPEPTGSNTPTPQFPNGLYIAAVTPTGQVNPYNPTNNAAFLAEYPTVAAGQNVPLLTRRFENGPRQYTDDLNTYRLKGELDGKIFDNYDWQVGYFYGQSSATYRVANETNFYHLSQELGMNSCGTEVGCSLGNFLGYNTLNQEQRQYLSFTNTDTSQYSLSDAYGNVSGPVYTLPAGDIKASIGWEYRTDNTFDHPDAVVASGDGAVYDLPTQGGYSTGSAYTEFNVPLLKDLPFAKALTLDASGRYDYNSTFGHALTHKEGLDWAIDDNFRIRGSHSTGFRAPQVKELYSGGFLTNPGGKDPCATGGAYAGTVACQQSFEAVGLPGNTQTGQITQLDVLAGGNPNLKPETSQQWSIGGVYTPTYVPGLSVTVDYYTIFVRDEIGALDANQILGSCYGNVPYVISQAQACALIGPRNSLTGSLGQVNAANGNATSENTDGIDLDLAYSLPTDDFGLAGGKIALSGQVNYLLSDNSIGFGGIVQQLAGTFDGGNGYAEPRFKALLGVDVDSGFGLSMSFDERYYGGIRNQDPSSACEYGVVTCPTKGEYDFEGNEAAGIFYTDISFTYHYENVRVTVGVDNLFDKDPPYLEPAGADEATESGAGYDFTGRFVYMKASINFGAPGTPSPAPAAPLPPPVVAPVAPPAAKVEAERSFQVFFDFDKSTITSAAAKVIQAAADAVKAGNVVKITVTGHTDTVGSAVYNQGLSERRAAAVKSTLVADGVAGGEITTIGVGKTGLLVPTADGVREPQNRRAEIVLQ